MAKIRVHELAKQMGIPSKQLVDILQGMGLNIKNHMSTLEDNQVNWVKKNFMKALLPLLNQRKTEAGHKQEVAPVDQTRDSQAKQQQKPSTKHQQQSTVQKPSSARHVTSTGTSHPPKEAQHREERPRTEQTRSGPSRDRAHQELQRGAKQQHTIPRPRGAQQPRDRVD